MQLSSLRVAPELDAGKYTAGAQEKVAADRAMAASSTAAGQAVAATDAKISASGDVLARLSRQYVDGARQAQKFETDLRGLNRGLEAGKISTEQASTILVGMNQKLGLSGDASALAAKGQTQLAAAVEMANRSMAAQGSTLTHHVAQYRTYIAELKEALQAEALRQIGAANQNRFNAVLGVQATPTMAARDSASVFEAEFSRIDDLAQMKAQQIGQNFASELNASLVSGTGKAARDSAAIFETELSRLDEIAHQRAVQTGALFTQDLNARLNVNGFGTSARASASVFEEAGREAERMTAKVAALRAELNPLAAMQDRVNAEIAEYVAWAQRGAISADELAQAQALARNRIAPAAGGRTGPGAFAAINATQQLQDVAIVSAMGIQSIPTIALQQGTQLGMAMQMSLGEQGAAGAAKVLGSALIGLFSPINLAAIALTGAAAAAIQFGSKLGGSSREAEEFAKWLEKIGGNANKSADFVDKLTDALKDMSGIDLNKLASGGIADIAKMRSELSNPLTASTGLMGLAGGYLGADPAFVQEYELIEKILTRLRSDEGFKSLEDLRRDLAQIVAQRPELQKYAETWEVLGENILKARDAVEEARRQADYRLHGMGAYQPRDGAAMQDYLTQNAGTLRQLQIDQEVSLQRIGARSPSELAAVARAAERAKPINGEESAEVRQFREDSAAALAYAEAQHAISEAQKDRLRSLDQTLASQKLDLDLIGKTAGEAAALRFEFEHVQQVREEAARNGVAADEKEIELIKAKAAEYGKYADAIALANLNRDLNFEFDQLRRSSTDQQIASRLRGAGLAVDFSSPEASAIRRNIQYGEIKDITKGFFTDMEAEFAKNGGNLGKAFGQAALNAAMKFSDKLLNNIFDRFATSVADMLMGGGKGGSAGIVSQLLGAANDNFAGTGRSSLPNIGDFAAAIKSIESSGRYNALGPVTASGDRAYGAYQVMGSNIGPWSRAALGYSLTPGQFLADPGAQDAIFSHRFGGYLSRFGSANDAAAAWFTGQPLAKGAGAVDMLGTSGAAYVNKFNAALNDVTGSAGIAADGLGTLGKGFDQFGSGIGQLGNALKQFPAAPSGGGGIFGMLGNLLGGLPSLGFMNSISPLATSFLLGGGVGLFASGTESAPSGWAWVGEGGPELLKLRGGETIRSHPHSMMMAANANAANSNQPLRIELVSRFDADGGFQTAVERSSRPIAQQESARAAGKLAQAVPGMVDARQDERETRRIAPRRFVA